MMRHLSFALLLFAFPGALRLSASLCVTDTLANYEALSSGCSLGSFTLTGFSDTQVSGSVIIPDSSITVTPAVGLGTLSLTFSSSAFNLSAPDSAVYLLGYTWDPGDIRSFEDILNANSPVFPGFAQISTELCENSAFSGASCPNAIDSLSVFDNGNTANLQSFFNFSPDLATVGVRDTITLDATAGGSSEFRSFA